MEILNKSQLDQILGKKSFWLPINIVNKVDYVSGIVPFDNLIKSQSNQLINIQKRPKGLQIELMLGFKYTSVGLLEDDIINIHVMDREQLYETKEKSVIGRAVVGGLLLGPLGAVVGGMSGMGKKQSKVNIPDLILSISYKSKGDDEMIIFSFPEKNKKEVIGFFTDNLPEKFTVEKVSDTNPTESNESPLNTIEELEKLVAMKEKGFINDEEFQSMKQKILNS